MANPEDDFKQQLDRLEADQPIPIDSVDFSLRNPDEVRQQLGSSLVYFCRVESEVDINTKQIRYLFPDLGGHTDRFLDIWLPQETRHGEIFGKLLDELEMDQAASELEVATPPLRLGKLASKVPYLRDVLMMNYLVRGAMHEKLTATGYGAMRRRLEDLGESDFVRTAIRPIQHQEGGHLTYYRKAAEEMREQLSPWQLRIARFFADLTYRPVGANNDDQKKDFGKVTLELVGEHPEALATHVQKLAENLIGAQQQGLELPQFVIKSLRECVEEARTTGLAA